MTDKVTDRSLAERARLLDAATARLERGALNAAERARLEYLETLFRNHPKG